MEGENKYDRTCDPFKLLIEEALTQQRNEMTDSFAYVCRIKESFDGEASVIF